MKKASKLLTKEELDTLSSVIADAERITSGEIVPIISSCSGRYYHANMIFGFVLALFTFITIWGITDVKPLTDWSEHQVISVSWPVFVLGEILAFIIGIYLIEFLPHLKLLFISQVEMQNEVKKTACEAFFNLHVGGTKAATGVVIYISLFEHIAYIQGDASISRKVSQKEWQHISDVMVQEIKQNRYAAGLKKGILKTGELLSKHFPYQEKQKNELANQIYLID